MQDCREQKKMMNFSLSSSHHQLVLLFLFAFLRLGCSFVVPLGQPSPRSVWSSSRTYVAHPSTGEVPKEGDSGTGPNEDIKSKSTTNLNAQKLLRASIVNATNSVLATVDQKPFIEVSESLAVLGEVLNEWDDQLVDSFAKGFGVTAKDLDNMSDMTEVDQLMELTSLSGFPPPTDDELCDQTLSTDVKAIDSAGASSAVVKTPTVDDAFKPEDTTTPTLVAACPFMTSAANVTEAAENKKVVKRTIKRVLAFTLKQSLAFKLTHAVVAIFFKAWRSRVRSNPVSVPVAEKKPFSAVGNGKGPTVKSGPRTKGHLGGFLPALRPRSGEAQVADAPDRWQLWSVGGVAFAFRKRGG